MSIKKHILEVDSKPQIKLKDIIAIDIKPNCEDLTLNLAFDLIVKIKMIKKINTFYKKIGFTKVHDIAPMQPVLAFLIHGTALSQNQTKAYFEFEKELMTFEISQHDLTETDYLKFSSELFALVLGVSSVLIKKATYKNDNSRFDETLFLQFDDLGGKMYDYLFNEMDYQKMYLTSQKFIKTWDLV